MPPKCREGCTCRKHRPNRKPRSWWTGGNLATLKANYDGTMESRRQLADMFDVSMSAVQNALRRSGLLMKGWEGFWAEDEVTQLIELVPKYRLGEVSERLGKSINAITSKMCRLKQQGIRINTRTREEWFTAGEIALILGVTPHRVVAHIQGGRLRAEPNDPNRPPKKGWCGAWRISLKSFRAFLKKYPDKLTVRRNTDFPVLVDVLTR